MATTGLLDYQLGDLLGRGASGNVYRALNFLTGETVAIKSISVQSLPASSLPDIMSEIDLLKNLNHPNIVKYKGFSRDKDSLFIILEYCENGSLQTILKKFGKFPESLVAVYVSQVLEGLVYLHEQGVIHRDIKGANILTNKDGSVKLADFGVSSRAPTPDLAAAASPDADNEVVGSPYWMAPEVIEQSGATTASDIWSVGCVVVELLEGKPPYGDLAPMQALWRIVQDESMRIPEGASPIVKDFLYQCFQKDANLRVSAKKLLRHAWMQTARKIQSDGSVTAGTAKVKTSSHKAHSSRGSVAAAPKLEEVPLPPRDSSDILSKQQISQAEAIQRVQEWNEALNASPKNFSTMRRIPAPPPRRGASEAGRTRADSVLAPVSSTAHPPTLAPPGAGGLLQKNQHVSDVLNRARENSETERWDDDFAFDVTIPTIQPRNNDLQGSHDHPDAPDHHDSDHETMRPSKPAQKSKSVSRLSGIVEDYSDLAVGEDELRLKLSSMKLRDKGRIRLMRPSDLQKIGTLQSPPAPPPKPTHTSMGPPPVPPKASMPPPPVPPPASPAPAPSPALPVSASSPTIASRTPPGSRNSSLRGRKAASESNPELQKYTEADDEDYSDVFDGPATHVDGANTVGSLQLTRRSNRSWKEEEEEDVDPFAEFDDEFDLDDLEANLHHNKKAALWEEVERLVDQMQANSQALCDVCDQLLRMFENTPADMGIERHFVQIHGMLAVLELLDTRLNRDAVTRLLRIVNFIVASDVDNLESFCLVGGIPVIIPYTSKRYALETRIEASIFIQHLTRSALTLQICRGLKVLVELLDEDYSAQKLLVLSALEGIGSVFDLQSPTPKPDFCRMFTREGILDPLACAIFAVSQDATIVDDTAKRSLDVLLLFCQVAQSDEHVRQGFASRNIMMRLLRTLDVLPDTSLVTAIKAIKHLATHPKLIEVLQNSNAMEILVNLLGKAFKGSYSTEICSQIFQAIYSMCRLSKSRQEEAASADIIPMLKHTIVTKSQLKQFALPILCDLANAGKSARRLLWANDGLSIYLGLLEDPYWRVPALEAILTWMSDETARVEDALLKKDAVDCLTKCFVQTSNKSFERILDPYLKLLRFSTPLSVAVASSPFLRRLADALERQGLAGVKLNLLRITKVVLEHHPDREIMVTRFSIDNIVEKLKQEDSPVLVRELAKEIYPVVVSGYQAPPPTAQFTTAAFTSSLAPPAKRVVSVIRRVSGDSGSGGSSRSTSRIMRVPSVLAPTSSQPTVSTLGLPRGESASSSRSVTPTPSSEHKKSKRPISRHQIKFVVLDPSDNRDVQWTAGENGRLKRTPSGIKPPTPTDNGWPQSGRNGTRGHEPTSSSPRTASTRHWDDPPSPKNTTGSVRVPPSPRNAPLGLGYDRVPPSPRSGHKSLGQGPPPQRL